MSIFADSLEPFQAACYRDQKMKFRKLQRLLNNVAYILLAVLLTVLFHQILPEIGRSWWLSAILAMAFTVVFKRKLLEFPDQLFPAQTTIRPATETDLLSEVSRRIAAQDWTSNQFSLEKAYVAALFAKLAYLHVPRFELEDKTRIKIVPCLAYQEIMLSGMAVEIREILARAELLDFFVVERRFAIVVGVQTPKVIIVAIRGTKYLYDWAINLNAIRRKPFGMGSTIYLHHGFFTAIATCFEEITTKLNEYLVRVKVPVYVVGHSLGGAMAAIMHCLSATGWSLPLAGVSTHSAYAFGMPRYGNLASVSLLRQPYHLYNELDIVPTVPPNWFGYASCFTEFMLNGSQVQKMHTRETLTFVEWISRLFNGSGIGNHMMELYLERVRAHVSP